MNSDNQAYLHGAACAALAGVFLSGAGLTVRYIEHADVWQVLFYRSLAFFVTVCLFITYRARVGLLSSFTSLRPMDFIVSVCLAIGFVFYLFSLNSTTVANTVLTLSTGPFIAALLGWLFLSERVAICTWGTMCVAVAGVAIMVSGGIGSGDLMGFGFALMAAVSFSVMIVVVRAAGDRDVIAATALAGLVAAALCLPFIQGFAISWWDLSLSIMMGSLQVGLGFILITLASRTVPAAQVPLLALTETALSPIWVWWFVDEVPAITTLMGGALVLCAVIYQGLSGDQSG